MNYYSDGYRDTLSVNQKEEYIHFSINGNKGIELDLHHIEKLIDQLKELKIEIWCANMKKENARKED